MPAQDSNKPYARKTSAANSRPGDRIYWEHEAQHLSTLVTSAKRPPPDSNASFERLRQLASHNQLTVTQVKLILREHKYRKELLVVNLETGDVCECIPLEDIISPIYKESNDPNDSYNNLLMFNVNACLNSRSGPPQNEMHIFQCVSAPAHEIVDALIDIQNNEDDDGGEDSGPERHESFPGPSMEPNNMGGKNGAENGMETTLTPQQLREKALIDREIVLLNMCFDDIESYVGHIYKLQRARLQNPTEDNVSIAGAGAESKGKKKKRRFVFKKRTDSPKEKSDIPRVTSNTSMASEVEIPISDKELIDLFEKIKFSIILLSRLQGYVTEPNPPQLTHKLFSMMKQPVDFIRDPVSGEPEMAQKVISPLFPEAAIKLIQNSLIEPELSLWRELGKGWCLPKEQWKEDIPTYIPQFKSGFKPKPDQYYYTLFDQPPPKNGEYGIPSSASRTKLALDHDGKDYSEYLLYLRNKGAKVARVMRDFLGEGEQEISLKAGEYVEVLNDKLNWNLLRNRKGAEGYAPYTILDYVA